MSTKKLDIGGQAVIEGVMMRNKNKLATAVRKKGKIIFKIEKIFNSHGLPTHNFFYEIINNVYFEPETYLLRYPDVLNAKVNPNLHYKNFGIKKKWF